MLERTVFNAANVLAGSTGCKAALTDLCQGEELAQAYGTLGAAQGLGVLGGSMLSGTIQKAEAFRKTFQNEQPVHWYLNATSCKSK